MLDLFSNEIDCNYNHLPIDGCLNYYGQIINHELAHSHFSSLMKNIDWKNDEAIVFGKRIVTNRKTAWYGDKPYSYTYSNIVRNALLWTDELLELKKMIEEKTGETFNSCLLNLYPSGNDGVSWHSDDEKMLKPNGTVASLSFGAERVFKFKHKEKELKTSILLEHGSLLLMKDSIQTHWLHCLPKTKKVLTPRINLTFRTIV